jgi:chaperonin GroEL
MSIRDFLSLLEKFVQQVKDVHPTPPLLVVAEAFSAEVFATLAINQLRGILNTFPLMIGPTESIEDFAVLTSGTLCKTSTAPINSDLKNIEELEIRDLGYAKLIDITEHSMKIIGGRGGKQDILKRMIFIEQEIKEAEKETENEIRISQLKARLSLLKSALGD